MLTTTFRRTHETIGVGWRRVGSSRELATLGETDRRGLGYPKNFATNKDDENEHHHRMFANLVAAAWVGTLMVSAYYVFSQLAAVS